MRDECKTREDLMSEVLDLRTQLDNLKFQNDMEKLKNDNNYEYSNVLKDIEKCKHLMMIDTYYVKPFVPLVEKWGYERVNSYMVKESHEINHN